MGKQYISLRTRHSPCDRCEVDPKSSPTSGWRSVLDIEPKQNSICTLVLRKLTSNRERLSATGSPWICTFPPPLFTTSNQVKSVRLCDRWGDDVETSGYKLLLKRAVCC